MDQKFGQYHKTIKGTRPLSLNWVPRHEGRSYQGSIPGRARQGMFSLRYRDQTAYGTCPPSYTIGTRDSSPRGEETEAWSWPPTPI